MYIEKTTALCAKNRAENKSDLLGRYIHQTYTTKHSMMEVVVTLLLYP